MMFQLIYERPLRFIQYIRLSTTFSLHKLGFFLLLGIGLQPLFAQQVVILINEDFSSGSGSTPPSGWTNNIISGAGSDVWRYDNPEPRTINSPISGTFAIFDSDNYSLGGGAENVALESPAFDAADFNTLNCSFDYYFNSGYGGAIYVEVYNGSSWTQVLSSTSTSANAASTSIDILTATNGASNAKVRFRWTGDYSWYWAVDNIVVTGVKDIDTDGDGVRDDLDLDDDNDGIPDLMEGGGANSCVETVVISGDAAGNLYQLNLNTGSSTLLTNSPYVSGVINSLAANPDQQLVYYGFNDTLFYYNPGTNSHGIVADMGGQISGFMESGGATYLGGNYYFATEPTGGGDHVNLYRLTLAADGLSAVGAPVALNPPLSGGYGDFVVTEEGVAGTLFGSTTTGIWKYDLNDGTYTLVVSGGAVYQMGATLNGDLWTGTGTSAQRMDAYGNLIGSAWTMAATATDMTGPFNCPQIDPEYDTDGDGIPNALDLDSDNDGIPDLVEAGGIDSNGDGLVDGLNGDGSIPAASDLDGDGWLDLYDNNPAQSAVSGAPSYLTLLDRDGDGYNDFVDLDADNDGIPDLVEAGGIDNNGDGRVDNLTDADNDGFADVYDADDDGTVGVEDSTDPLLKTSDTDLDNLPETYLSGSGSTMDRDQDGYPDAYDLDADNDGIPDVIEAGGVDNDGDGHPELTTDVDNDGLIDVYDMDNDDGPGTGSLTDGSALVRTDGTDTDADGKPNEAGFVYEHGNNTSVDTDGDGYPDFIDLDADDDGIPDLIEAGGIDADGNGKVDNARKTDTDGDGLADTYDADASDGPAGNGTDGSALVQSSGADTSTDGLADGDNAITYQNGAGATFVDQDGDGLPNHLDLDADNDGILDVVEVGATDADNDGHIDGAVGSNGYANAYDPADGGTARLFANADGTYVLGATGLAGAYADTDEDDVPDFVDIDADNDGILDYIEAQATGSPTNNCYVVPNTTYDSNGVPTAFSSYQNCNTANVNSGSPTYGISPYNQDGTDLADYIDTDSDNDGDPDMDEAWDSSTDGNGTSDYQCSTDADGDGLLTCFDNDDADHTDRTNANAPPVDNAYEVSQGGGVTGSSAFGSLDGATVLNYDIFPNNQGDNGNIQPDWRDNGCNLSSSLYYPITGTDAIYSGGTHSSNPSATNGTIRSSDYCTGTFEAGWTYYYDPLNSDKILFAVEHGLNQTQIDFVQLRRDATDGRNVANNSTGFGYFVMPRDWSLETVGGADLLEADGVTPATINIRFYFDPADSTTMMDTASQFSSNMSRVLDTPKWFRTSSPFDNSEINTNSGLQSATGYAEITPADYGTEAGLHYVQFDNLSEVFAAGMGIGVDGSLPVEWLNFDVLQQGGVAQLNWGTNQELNNDYFEVQRTTDGRIFENLGIVQGAGNSSVPQHYQFRDEQFASLNQTKVAYRIRQVDFDGGYSYSSLVELSLEAAQRIHLLAFPNPAKQYIQVEWELEAAGGEAELFVINSLGVEVWRLSAEELRQQNQLSIPVENWAAGLYYISLKQTDIRTFKIWKN